MVYQLLACRVQQEYSSMYMIWRSDRTWTAWYKSRTENTGEGQICRSRSPNQSLGKRRPGPQLLLWDCNARRMQHTRDWVASKLISYTPSRSSLLFFLTKEKKKLAKLVEFRAALPREPEPKFSIRRILRPQKYLQKYVPKYKIR